MVRVPPGMTLVVGLGVSGRAICRHLARLDVPFMVADTREEPPGLAAFRDAHPEVVVHCGPLEVLNLEAAEEVVISPGVDPHHPVLAPLAGHLNPCTGDPRLVGEMALFTRATRAPIAAITGSNAKSSVTTLLGKMAQASGVNAAVGGNLGTAALDLLAQQPDAELFILELSSFQLETTPCLGAKVAAFLNLSEDHLDRHGDMQGYRKAKQGIFRGAQHAIVNADDPMTFPSHPPAKLTRFGHQPPSGNDWGLAYQQGRLMLMQGATPWLDADQLAMVGRHHYVNGLAALAMGDALGFDPAAMCEALKAFKGLPHRSEFIAELNGVKWVNDTKGTNVGATLAAIEGIGTGLTGQLILLAGGVGKGADFAPLAEPLRRAARCVVLFGQDALRLEDALAGHVETRLVPDLAHAMEEAYALAQPGDCVLLSPACASLDQFANYQARGDVFRDWVTQKAQQSEATP
ncbi:UDP-N-acetylmuramoyl-L-alanine--D-glutamate ligase [Halomonas sp. HL-93]|uniref:UDP-N-acetylmuramoyl-L-alanine--D-glutamate ligase n=1 Tax=Halomonas sp. HL-93 TaxID=1666906 RepID=UPI0006DB084C|nr:UDP-N-acetylmuramoyl-L-alanine--D-glutamate ligase [Halomonas sp. HL-93]KPQ26601.1 MAG: UDP-N-acetylmuramoylalanine--D-glutamate ligase MurD [Halomonas sp. HL-93]SBR49597.1 UDP-N-acetylmuramoylalanine--D-glutamate ligase [Halomonas sp. HL-93]